MQYHRGMEDKYEDVYVVKKGNKNGPFTKTTRLDGGVADYPVCHLCVKWPDHQEQDRAKRKILFVLNYIVDVTRIKLWNTFYNFESSIDCDDVSIDAKNKLAYFGYAHDKYYYFDDDSDIPKNLLRGQEKQYDFKQFCQKLTNLRTSSSNHTNDQFSVPAYPLTEKKPLPVSSFGHHRANVDFYVVKVGTEHGPFRRALTLNGDITDFPRCHLYVTWPDQQEQHFETPKILFTLGYVHDVTKPKLKYTFPTYQSSIYCNDVLIIVSKKCAYFPDSHIQYCYFDDDFRIQENLIPSNITRSYFEQFRNNLRRFWTPFPTHTPDHFRGFNISSQDFSVPAYPLSENWHSPVSFLGHHLPQQSGEDEESDTDTDISDDRFEDAAIEKGMPNPRDNILQGGSGPYGMYNNNGLWIPWPYPYQGAVGHMNPGRTD